MQVHTTVALIQNALAYARFPHSVVRQELDSYLKTLGNDLTDADYTQQDEVDIAMGELNEVLNDVDSAKLETTLAIKDATEDAYAKSVEDDS